MLILRLDLSLREMSFNELYGALCGCSFFDRAPILDGARARHSAV